MIFTKVIDLIQFKDVCENDLNLESCTVPGAGLTVKDIYHMYSRGEVPRPTPAYDEGSTLREEYIPRDPMEAMQMSQDFVASQVAAAQVTAASQNPVQVPETAQNSTESQNE